MLWENGDRVPCAFKKVPYESHAEQCRAEAELAALRDAEGCEHIVQCYGAFDHCEPADGKHYLWTPCSKPSHHIILWLASISTCMLP